MSIPPLPLGLREGVGGWVWWLQGWGRGMGLVAPGMGSGDGFGGFREGVDGWVFEIWVSNVHPRCGSCC
jgi:hypothetical protein